MELNDRVTQLEDEIKVLKNEVQAVLLDLRESYLDRENPFNPDAPPITNQPIIINQQPPIAREEPGEMMPREEQDSEPVGESDENELPEVEEPANEPEPFDEPAPVYKQELIVSDETAHEEVKRAWRPVIGPEDNSISRDATDGSDGKVDLATISGLAQWVAGAVKRLGRERTEAILDISEMMGHLAPELKNILVRFIGPAPDEYSGEVTTRDYLASIIELDTLLGRDNKSEVALLYILCQENDHR